MKTGLAPFVLAALLLNAGHSVAQPVGNPAVAAQGVGAGGSAAEGVTSEGIAPSRWQPALPHEGQRGRLLRWWAQWNDPLMLSLIAAAQSQQADLPRSVRAIEHVHDILPPEQPAHRADPASWEASMAQAAHGGAMPSPGSRADADWHPARVAVAAETAEQYLGWLHCRRGGGACAARLRALAILTGLPIGDVGERLLARGLHLPEVPAIREPRLRARLLEQRPDVAAAMLALEQTRIEIGRAEAQRHPRLQLLGEVASHAAGNPALAARLHAASVSTASDAPADTGLSAEIVGPALSVPPFDASRLQSVVEARQADYLAAASALRSRALEAVRESTQALDQLTIAQNKAIAQSQSIAQNQATAPHTGQSALTATGLTQALQDDAWLEQAIAWVHLYRVVSGGWGREARASPLRP